MSVNISLRRNQLTALTWMQEDENFQNLANAATAVANGGTTAARPLSPVLFQTYFDTDLGIPVYCSQISPYTIWVNAAGVVS